MKSKSIYFPEKMSESVGGPPPQDPPDPPANTGDDGAVQDHPDGASANPDGVHDTINDGDKTFEFNLSRNTWEGRSSTNQNRHADDNLQSTPIKTADDILKPKILSDETEKQRFGDFIRTGPTTMTDTKTGIEKPMNRKQRHYFSMLDKRLASKAEAKAKRTVQDRSDVSEGNDAKKQKGDEKSEKSEKTEEKKDEKTKEKQTDNKKEVEPKKKITWSERAKARVPCYIISVSCSKTKTLIIFPFILTTKQRECLVGTSREPPVSIQPREVRSTVPSG